MTLVSDEHLAPPTGAKITLSDVPTRDFTHYETGLSIQGIGYNKYAKAFHEACLRKTAENLGLNFKPDIFHRCNACLYETRMPGIYMHSDGRCNMCHAYEIGYEGSRISGSFKRELTECLDPDSTQNADCDAVLGLSGGKDSSAVLSYLTQETDLRVTAVLVDNGFIPEFVKDNCSEMCARTGAEFVLKSFDFHVEMGRATKNPEATEYPCNTCSKSFSKIIADVAAGYGCQRVILGRNFWYRIEPKLTAVKKLMSRAGSEISFTSLPFLMRWKIEDIDPRLDQIGWARGGDKIVGLSTNCTVPGKVESLYHDVMGIHPEAALISNEIICGFISRSQGKKELDILD